ncbi:MAG: hypothetical protein B7C24_07470, partial [Bacteroidetes bacterium 4572_77]
NTYFKDTELFLLINSTASKKSIMFNVLDYYHSNINKNKYSPDIFEKEIDVQLEKYKGEISFYNEIINNEDVAALELFYKTYGFHDVVIYSTFELDTNKWVNALTFYIIEGERYSISEINLNGIDKSTGGKRYRDYYKNVTRQIDGYFDENALMEELKNLNYQIRNNGYFYSKYSIKPVEVDTVNKINKIEVDYKIGRRQYYGDLEFVNDNREITRDVARSIKEKYTRIRPGKYYRVSDISQTEFNLTNLRLFDNVYIDTFNVNTPDTLNYIITTQLGKRYELDAGVFINHTPADNFVNAGIDGRFTFRNPFGGGEEIVTYGNLSVKDVNNIMTDVRIVGKVGVNFFQPMMIYYKGTRIGAAANIEYSKKKMDNFMVDHWYLPKFTFPWYLKKYTYFNKLSANISLEGEYPRNYTSVIDTASVGSSTNTEDLRNMVFFKTLNSFWESDQTLKLWTATILGLNVIGDHRNHPFSPTHGYYTRLNFDVAGLVGIAEFFNLHATHQQYTFPKRRKNQVHAYRINVGKIFYNSNNTAKYVPFEYQYFCGGANSNRGWLARQLHSSNVEPVLDKSASSDSLLSLSEYMTLSNIYGSAGIFEFNYEYRYNFYKRGGLTLTGKDRISNFGVIGFIDIGNSYGWFIDGTDKADNSFGDYISYFINNLAVSTGFGIRYETPIGPLRLDLGIPVYGPIPGKNDLIFKRSKPIEEFKLFFGIGHTF